MGLVLRGKRQREAETLTFKAEMEVGRRLPWRNHKAERIGGVHGIGGLEAGCSRPPL